MILGLSTDRDGRAVVESFVDDRGVTYPIAMSTASLERQFGGLRGLPMSFLVDRSGQIRHKVFGYFAGPTLRLAVRRLLDEEGPDAAITRARHRAGARSGTAHQPNNSP
ncbi:MAG: TlpA family protein disulfide reductase [Gemmatimonadetes bacterium]|nr:TlpA family protein disulfide reductase [Gemmatimonadota bacterium]